MLHFVTWYLIHTLWYTKQTSKHQTWGFPPECLIYSPGCFPPEWCIKFGGCKPHTWALLTLPWHFMNNRPLGLNRRNCAQKFCGIWNQFGNAEIILGSSNFYIILESEHFLAKGNLQKNPWTIIYSNWVGLHDFLIIFSDLVQRLQGWI